MLRIHFTAEDLLRTRLAAGPAPLIELGMAVATLQRGDPVFARWARRTRRPRAALPLFELIPPTAAGPLFVDPVSDGFDDGLDRVLSTPDAYARAEILRACRPTPWTRGLADHDSGAWRILEEALRSAYDAIIAPEWPRIRASFDADVAWRRTLLAGGGIRETLTGLHPGARWNGTTLEFDVAGESEHTPGGRGVTLLPSSVWTGRPLVGTHSDGSMLLVYPSLTPMPLVDTDAGDALAALLGPTRAAVLALLVDDRTNGEVARRAGISAASASAHAKTLREAGLVVTRRAGKAVLHVATPLGLRLLDGA
ncbi:winged helix-turn-helix domain-containing protein [Actinoallomurus purpureus]|uniref:ArsR/SmtB family transcription factor n=1 Tax=Actinoallomurus purpureus TaxID=478114 RepID=UPI0020928381|nr:helix-turn-helix domain-containing protein [Actinoallomurus purpureus]MCO6010707.1 winged helix-turn-helix domain-containing protein [Actinoallomurus purpureus]